MDEHPLRQTLARLKTEAETRGLEGARVFLNALDQAAQEKREQPAQPAKTSRLHYTLD